MALNRASEGYRHVHHIHSEPVNPLFKPKAHGAVIDGLPRLLILPVQVRLLFSKQMQVILPSMLVILPGLSRKVAPPVGRRQPRAVLGVARRLPDVPGQVVSLAVPGM